MITRSVTAGIDPVELGLIAPILTGVDGFMSKVEEIVNLGFDVICFTSRACRIIWTKVMEWIQSGEFTPNKLLSFCLKCEEIAPTEVERSQWLSEASMAGDLLFMVENAIELIERKLRQETEESIASLPAGTATQMLNELEEKIAVIRSKTLKHALDEKIEACNELLEELDAMRRGERVAKTSHVAIWDQCLGGLPQAQLIVISGRPGGGKTSLAEQIIDEALRAGDSVLYIQRELSRSRAVGRLAARKAGVFWSKMEKRNLTQIENSRLTSSIMDYQKFPLFLAPVSTCNASTIAPLVRFHAKQNGVRLVVMDYVQLINVPRGVERRIAIGDVTRTLKLIANETKATVIAIAQLSRDTERRADKPNLSDLKESGDIEQDADVVLGLWAKDRDDAPCWPVNWTVMKNRNGGLGTVEVMFDGPSMSFLGRKIGS